MRGRLAFGIIGVLALTTVAAACGGDDDSGGSSGGGGSSAEAQPYVDALKNGMTTDSEDGFTLTAKQADCVAPKWIDTIGVDTLKAKNIKPQDIGSKGGADLSSLGLSEDQGNKLYDAFGQCDVDIKGLFVNSINPSMTDADAKCLDDNFDEGLLKQIMVTTLTKGDDALNGDETLTGKLLAVFSKCPGAIPKDDS